MLKCKRQLASKFNMKDLGLMHYFLALEVWKIPHDIFIPQGKYIVNSLEIFGVVECKSLATPMEMNYKKLCGDAARTELENPSKY